jgi:hypothetical protein
MDHELHELPGRGLYRRLFPRRHVDGAGAANHNRDAPSTGQDSRSSQISVADQDLIRKLEGAGYTQVRDIKSAAEGISAKETKDGRDLVADSSGKFRAR